MTYSTASGKGLRLGRQLGQPGGEGTVFKVEGQRDVVAKLYHAKKRTPQQHAKIRAMVSSKPVNRTIRESQTGKMVPTVAWPEDVVLENGQFAGFLMGSIDMGQAVEIAMILNPMRRENRPWTKNMGLGLRSFVAMNLAAVVGQIHSVGAVIGDFNERNVIVSRELIVSIIDCDSMQIKGSSGKYYLCTVFAPGFTAPEMVGKDLHAAIRPQASDLFNLAVHVYYLLMDRHPFRNGIWTGPGEKPSAENLARQGQWRGRSQGLLTPKEPRSLDPRTFLPTSTLRLFERAFEAGATTPGQRPTAAEWAQELGQFIGGWKP